MAPCGAAAGPCSVPPVRTACSWTPLAFVSSAEGWHAQPPLWVSLCSRPFPFHSLDACLMPGVRGHWIGGAEQERHGSHLSFQLANQCRWRLPSPRREQLTTENGLFFGSELRASPLSRGCFPPGICFIVLTSACLPNCGERKEEMVWCGCAGKALTSALFLTGEL